MKTLVTKEGLRRAVTAAIPQFRLEDVVFACIGTDRSTGDSLGPLVGSFLQERFPDLHIIGTLDDPLHAENLEERLSNLPDGKIVIAVDSCLGRMSSVGSFQVAKGPMHPGAGVNKDLPPVGDYHITGIVNIGGFMEYFILQNTRLSLVMGMAKEIAASVEHVLQPSEKSVYTKSM